MREFYLYEEISLHKTIKEIFSDFEIHIIYQENIKKNNFANKNILLILNESLPTELGDFFLKNNVVIFFYKPNNKYNNKYLNTKIFSGHTNINKFKDEVITFFVSKPFDYKDIKIRGEKIINSKSGKSVFLTSPEKDILILLLERKEVGKKFLLENILKLRKDTETKTIESHLTRIRKKLLIINSQIEIISKENTFFIKV
tara:strand:- start:81 stop:680 length:600 start_codon:yes stop_codon:yes gene_type:complete